MTDVFSPDSIANIATEAGLECPEPRQISKLFAFTELLARWNQRTNLVGPREARDIFCTLVLDSFHLVPFLRAAPLPKEPVCWELGAGAGVLGIPLRLLWDEGAYHLIELREKRALFMRTALAHLALPRTYVHQKDARAFMRERANHNEAPALVLSRAFMPWPDVLDFVRPWVGAQSRILVLATCVPPSSFPHPWKCEHSHAYPVAGKTRWFWLMRQGRVNA